MEKYDIYEDVAKRTDGNIYLGVVGPVRTGKSTFVKRFAELMIMPNIVGKNKKQIAQDELPLSGDGKTITTTEPKFMPSEAVKVSIKGTTCKMRLIDCVGFTVEGAFGVEENGEKRMVKTPWNDGPIPFSEAAEIGTEKVISDHSTVGVVITTDGSFTDIPRENYVPAEEKAVFRLKEIGKPFVIVLNVKEPNSELNRELNLSLREKYGVAVVNANLLEDGEEKFKELFEQILGEFPIKRIDVCLPKWLSVMDTGTKVVGDIFSAVSNVSKTLTKMKDCNKIEESLLSVDKIIPSGITVDAGSGRATLKLTADSGLFYEVLSETVGENISDENTLMSFMKKMSDTKWRYDRVKGALSSAEETGYGVVMPCDKDTVISSPEVVRQGGRYAVKINAETESLHIIKVGVKSSISPISGTKQQCDDFVKFLQSDSGENIENASVFGRNLGDVVNGGILELCDAMPSDTKQKVQKSISKIVNDKRYRVLYLVY